MGPAHPGGSAGRRGNGAIHRRGAARGPALPGGPTGLALGGITRHRGIVLGPALPGRHTRLVPWGTAQHWGTALGPAHPRGHTGLALGVPTQFQRTAKGPAHPGATSDHRRSGRLRSPAQSKEGVVLSRRELCSRGPLGGQPQQGDRGINIEIDRLLTRARQLVDAHHYVWDTIQEAPAARN